MVMVNWLCDIHIWSLKSHSVVTEADPALFIYREKNDYAVSSKRNYIEEKTSFIESRDAVLIPKNKRPERLKDTIKEFEELLAAHKCINCKWLNRRLVQIFLANGVLVTAAINTPTGDLEKIVIDKSLSGKLSSEIASDVLMLNHCLIFAFKDKNKIDYVYFNKLLVKGGMPKVFERLNSYEPKIIQYDLPGPFGRLLKRRISSNIDLDLIIVWWPPASGEAWPWCPMNSDKDRANVVLFSVKNNSLSELNHMRTNFEPINVTFSSRCSSHIISVEQYHHSDTFQAELCKYKVNSKEISKIDSTAITLQGCILSVGWNTDHTKLLLGCEKNTLVLYDENREKTIMTDCAVTPHMVFWHPNDLIVGVANQKGEIQIFDRALTPLLCQKVGETSEKQKTLAIGSFFRSTPTIEIMNWCPLSCSQEMVSDCTDSILVICNGGPAILVNYYLGIYGQGYLSPSMLVNEYLKNEEIDQALNLLLSMNWNKESKACLLIIMTIANHIFKESLTEETEVQLEIVLGSFYTPAKPLSEDFVVEYRESIGHIARRFFHHLLRQMKFEKAFLLAVDIGAKDLFMDIHYVALDKGEKVLADVSKRKADDIEAGFTSDSFSDDDSSDDLNSSCDNYDKYDQRPYDDEEEQCESTPLKTKEITGSGINHEKQLPEAALQKLEEELYADTIAEFTRNIYNTEKKNQSKESEDIKSNRYKVVSLGVL